MNSKEFKHEAERLMYSIYTEMEACARQFYEPIGLTAPQGLILMSLYRSGPSKVTDTAKRLNMTNSNLSTICRRLERDGFLTRTRDTNDQRIVWLQLTPSCASNIKELEAQIDCHYLTGLNEISDADRQLILGGMTKLNELLIRRTK